MASQPEESKQMPDLDVSAVVGPEQQNPFVSFIGSEEIEKNDDT